MSYHHSRSARDRDRLRQSVLESQGWTLLRIWGCDWFRQPRAQTERVWLPSKLRAAQTGRTSSAANAHPSVTDSHRSHRTRSTVQEAPRRNRPPALTTASIRKPALPFPPEKLHSQSTAKLAQLMHQAVELEGPIHLTNWSPACARSGACNAPAARVRCAGAGTPIAAGR
jgi:hypothetical protein